MKNIKKMMLALTMLSLGSVHISASSIDPVTEKVSVPPNVDKGIKAFTPFSLITPGKSDFNNKSGKWYQDKKTATANGKMYTNVYAKSGITGHQSGQGDTDFTPPAGYENIGILSMGGGSSQAGYGISYLFGKPAQALPVDSGAIHSGLDGQQSKLVDSGATHSGIADQQMKPAGVTDSK